jgi:hypothetical protein
MGVVPVSGGTTSTVTVHASREASLAVLKTSPAATRQIVLPGAQAPIKRGQQMGVVNVVQGGKVLVSVALLADSSVATAAPAPVVSVVPSATPAADSGATLWSRVSGLPQRMLVALASTL